MHYKFLLFDLDHTLLDFDLAEDLALTAFLKEQGVADIQAYKDYYIPMNKALWRDLEQEKLTKSELINTRFSRLFNHFGVDKDGVELALHYQQHIAQQGQTYTGASELLDVLTRRIMNFTLLPMVSASFRLVDWVTRISPPILIRFSSLSNSIRKNPMLYFLKK